MIIEAFLTDPSLLIPENKWPDHTLSTKALITTVFLLLYHTNGEIMSDVEQHFMFSISDSNTIDYFTDQIYHNKPEFVNAVIGDIHYYSKSHCHTTAFFRNRNAFNKCISRVTCFSQRDVSRRKATALSRGVVPSS